MVVVVKSVDVHTVWVYLFLLFVVISVTAKLCLYLLPNAEQKHINILWMSAPRIGYI